nr:MAG TPA: Protein of unknown function (DUF1642) [Caudoviricetes sp.]
MNKQELIEKYEKLEGVCKDPGAEIARLIFLEDLWELDEPQKVTVPQFVADWYKENKDDFETNLFRTVDLIPSCYEEGELSDFEEWLVDEHTKPFQTLVNMHQFGYKVKTEKRYSVKIKGVVTNSKSLKHNTNLDKWYMGRLDEFEDVKTYHTKEELISGGFSGVFNNPMFEVKEVE